MHCGFVTVLFWLFWECTHFYSSLPAWMKEGGLRKLSALDVAICVVFILMVTVEQKWILRLKSASSTVGVAE